MTTTTSPQTSTRPISNRAPTFRWFRYRPGEYCVRYCLEIDSGDSPYFIDRARYSIGAPSRPYTLRRWNEAGEFSQLVGDFRTLAEAKQRAIALATGDPS